MCCTCLNGKSLGEYLVAGHHQARSQVLLQFPRFQQLQQRVIACAKYRSLLSCMCVNRASFLLPLSCTCEPVASVSTCSSPTRGISMAFGSSVVRTMDDDMSYSASWSNACFGTDTSFRLPAVSRRLHPWLLRCHTCYFSHALSQAIRACLHTLACQPS